MRKAMLWIGGLVLALLVTAAVVSYSAAAGFARHGGELDLFSPSTEVDVVGDGNSVVAITGDDNSATVRPVQERDPAFVLTVLIWLFWLALIPLAAIVIAVMRGDGRGANYY